MSRPIRTILALCVIVMGTLFLAAQAHSQQASADVDAPDYEIWASTLQRAQRVSKSRVSSVEALREARAEMAGWRDRLLIAQSQNAVQIGTLREQIAVLDAGQDGEEREQRQDIVTQRERLQALLDTAQAPERKAKVAHLQALGLIEELDDRIRRETRGFLLERHPSPLSPRTLIAGLESLAGVAERVRDEIAANVAHHEREADTPYRWGPVIALALLGLAILAFSIGVVRRWLGRRRGRQTRPGPRERLGNFLLSLLMLIVPAIGIACIGLAITISGASGLLSTTLTLYVSFALFTIFLFDWMANRISPDILFTRPLMTLERGQPRQLRSYSRWAAFVSAFIVMDDSSTLFGIDENAEAVFGLVTGVGGGWLLWKIARILHKAPADDPAGSEEPEDPGSSLRLYLARAMSVAAVALVVLALIGYIHLSQTILFAVLDSLLLIAGIWILQNLARDMYAVLYGEEALDAGLTSIVIDTCVVLIAIPLFALIWGFTWADLSDAWAVAVRGVRIGETHLTATTLVTLVAVFGIGFIVTRLLQRSLRTHVLPRTRMDAGGRNATVAGVGYVGIFLAALLAISSAGIDLSSLAIVLGALSVGIGFGLQNIVSNFVSGIILLIERPIAQGDWIEIGDTMGIVRDISVRATRVETFDKRDVMVPNADLISTSVTNWTKGNVRGRILLTVGVSYRSDTDQVMEILSRIANDHPAVSSWEKPTVVIARLGADAVEFEIRAVLYDVSTMMTTTSDLYASILRTFRREDIEIPVPQRDVWFRDDAGRDTLSPVQTG